MRLKIGVLAALAGLALGLGTLSSASRAAIVETIIDTDSDTTLAGDSDAGAPFSFDGFTQADMTSISSNVDPTTADVPTRDLNALQGDNPCPNGGMDCSDTTLNLSPSFAMPASSSCSSSEDIDRCEESLGEADVRLVPAPQPSTWATMVVGFVGLGVGGY